MTVGGPEPSHHLLRTLAAVAPGTRILLLEDEPCQGAALEALGFAVATEPAGDAAHDWVVAWCPREGSEEIAGRLAAARAAVAAGGWVWVAAGGVKEPRELEMLAAGAGLALAEAPAHDRAGDLAVVRGVFRRVEAGVVG